MGWRFDLKDANIVAYLTSQTTRQAPRITRRQLGSFLRELNDALAMPDMRVFLSSDGEWSKELSETVNDAYAKFRSVEKMRTEDGKDLSDLDLVEQALIYQFREYVRPDDFPEILSSLRAQFNRFDLYGLPIDPSRGKITELAEQYALKSRERGLFLIPSDPPFAGDDSTVKIDFLDPFPAVAALAEADISEPGILLWTSKGLAAYQTDPFFLEFHLDRLIESPVEYYTDIFDRLASHGGNQTRDIIHLSDLHFGTEYAYKNRTALKNELRRQGRRWGRSVVVTGDLFEVLDERDALDFEDFRFDIAEITGRDIIVIPGNHDQRIAGNSFGFVAKKLAKIAQLEWTELCIDDDNQCVFFCFDSSFDNSYWAKGTFSDNQRRSVENAFNAKILRRPEVKDYFRVTLIHHHPFSFETSQESFIQRMLTFAGMTDERFLAMDRSEHLVKWCANMEIPLILHGHKHVQRHFTKNMTNKSGKNINVTAAGCGASLGAEDNPLTYNVISFNDQTKSFGVTFYEDDGAGGGFVPVKISLQVVA